MPFIRHQCAGSTPAVEMLATETTAVAAFSESTVIYRAMTPYGTVLNGTGISPDNRACSGTPIPRRPA